MGLDTAGNYAKFRAGNEQYLGQSRLGAYNTLGQQQQSLNEFNTLGSTQAAQAGESAASGRAATTAQERADAARYAAQQRFGQGQQVAGSLSQGQQNIAAQRLAGEQERRGYLAGMTGSSMQGALTSAGQESGRVANQLGAGNTAAGQYGGYDINRRNILRGTPTGAQQAIGAAVGALGGG
jgi:hypothetical protein